MGPNYKQLKDKEHTFSLTTRYLIGAARSSLKISLMLNMMLFFMRPGSGSCHRWKKEIRTGPKATREKVGWYWYIYILCIVTYQTSNRWESANIAQTCAGRTPYPSNSITCSSCTAMVFKKWCAYIGGSSDTGSQAEGGATRGSENSGAGLIAFVWAGEHGSCVDRLDWSGAFNLTVCRGICRYWSRQDRRLWGEFGPFSFGWVGNGVGK